MPEQKHKVFAEQLDEEYANKLAKKYLQEIRKSRKKIIIPKNEVYFIKKYATIPEKKTLSAHLIQPGPEKDYIGRRFTLSSIWNSLTRRRSIKPPRA